MQSPLASTAARRARLIPPEFGWIYLIGPIATAPLLIDQMFERSGLEILRGLALVAVPFAFLLPAFQILYTRILPPVVERIERQRTKWLFHVAVTTMVPLAMAPAIIPLEVLIKGRSIPLTHLLVPLVVVSWAFGVPALIIQQLRNRAHAGEERASAAERTALRAQLEALQARANPHFFFNSMNTIADLIVEDPELAERTVERLAELMRYTLDASRTPTVPLARELDIVRDYLAIQAARFGDRLDVSLEVDPVALGIPVPPLLVQPLVENAVVHGLSDRSRGRVRIEIGSRERWVEVRVSDDGPGPDRSVHRGSQTALRDLRERMALLYGDSGRFEVGAGPDGGFQVKMGITLAISSPP